MAWIDIHKNGVERYRVTEESYELIFKEQGYTICDDDTTPKKSYESPEISMKKVGDKRVSSRSLKGKERKG